MWRSLTRTSWKTANYHGLGPLLTRKEFRSESFSETEFRMNKSPIDGTPCGGFVAKLSFAVFVRLSRAYDLRYSLGPDGDIPHIIRFVLNSKTLHENDGFESLEKAYANGPAHRAFFRHTDDRNSNVLRRLYVTRATPNSNYSTEYRPTA